MRRDALESRADRGMRAYVTSSDDARDAHAGTLRPLATSCGELDGSRHTSGAKAFAHAPPVGGDLGVGLG